MEWSLAGGPAHVVGGEPVRRAGRRRRGGGRRAARSAWWSRCGCCGTGTSRGRPPAWPRSGSTRTPPERRACGRCRSGCTTPTGRTPRTASCAASWSRPCATTTGAAAGGRASSAAGSTTARSGVRPARDGADGIELWIEAFLGGAVLQPGERRELHEVVLAEGDGDPSSLLEAWAGALGAAGHARTTAPYQVGWCSWYHYFHAVTEADLRVEPRPGGATGPSTCSSSTTASRPPSATGSTPTTSSRRPSTGWRPPSRRRVARRASGSRRSSPGADSEVARGHPDWLAVHPASGTAAGRHGERRRGAAPSTPSTRRNPEVLDHLEDVARSLVEAGLPLPEARLHLRPVDPRRLRRPEPHAGAAGAGRLRGRPPRRRRRHVPARLRRPARPDGGRGRRHAHRRRRGAVVAPAGRPVPTAGPHRAASRPP